MEIEDQSQKKINLEQYEFNAIKINQDYCLKYVSKIFEILQNSELQLKSLKPDQDIVKNIYEGGFKIWECTVDLINFLIKNYDKINFSGKNVADLGCGHGLLGIYALIKNANYVLFQDYNQEVLQIACQPNIAENMKNQSNLSNYSLISCDWDNLVEKLQQNSEQIQKFDIILMSEVIYDKDNYSKILNLLPQILEKNGMCLMANKVFYFGVGGSIPEFMDFAEKNYSNLILQSEELINTKKGNKREIISIQLKQ